MRFDVQHPSDPTVRAEVGLDHAVGFFITTYKGRRVVRQYDALHRGYNGLPGLLAALVAHGFFTEDDVLLARQELAHRGAGEVEDRDVRRAAEVIENLRAAAAEEG